MRYSKSGWVENLINMTADFVMHTALVCCARFLLDPMS